MNRLIRVSIGLGTFLVIADVISCSSTVRESGSIDATNNAPQQPATGPVATTHASWTADGNGKHWVQNDQLRSLMKSLSGRTQRDWPRGVPQDPEDEQNGDLTKTMDSAAVLADHLADTAIQIPASVIDSKMSEADLAGFQAEANTLHRQAVRLGESARARKVEPMQKSLDAIGDTCISCHTRYRDFSGQLRSQ